MNLRDFAATGAFDWAWGAVSQTAMTQHHAGGDARGRLATQVKLIGASDVQAGGGCTRVLISVPWDIMGWRPFEPKGSGHGGRLRVQLNRNHRGHTFQGLSTHATLSGIGHDATLSGIGHDAAAEAELWGSFSYSCAAPCADDTLSFHRESMFVEVEFER